ncbi:unnamed protein product [Cyprideis torosa]|uniref:General transcription factor IIH subunit 3 n=1 Tax=Cyprideis torosa TaxID=163714 RepID=A0A7R8WD30_9CRUS|nr:unnamed protein product [Cyprideis torosa]CAG0894211.1 unnamed protein product [Cyprideis torosa]
MSDLISSKDKHSLESDTDVSESFLVLVVDLSTLAWAKFSEYSFKSPLRNGVESAPVNGESKSTVLTNVLDALLVFCNAFVALQVSSKLAVIGCNAHESTIIYPNDGTHNISITRAGGQMPTFVEITENIKIGVREMARREAALVQSGDLDAEQESLLAGGICRAACLAKSGYSCRILLFEIFWLWLNLNQLTIELLVSAIGNSSALALFAPFAYQVRQYVADPELVNHDDIKQRFLTFWSSEEFDYIFQDERWEITIPQKTVAVKALASFTKYGVVRAQMSPEDGKTKRLIKLLVQEIARASISGETIPVAGAKVEFLTQTIRLVGNLSFDSCRFHGLFKEAGAWLACTALMRQVLDPAKEETVIKEKTLLLLIQTLVSCIVNVLDSVNQRDDATEFWQEGPSEIYGMVVKTETIRRAAHALKTFNRIGEGETVAGLLTLIHLTVTISMDFVLQRTDRTPNTELLKEVYYSALEQVSMAETVIPLLQEEGGGLGGDVVHECGDLIMAFLRNSVMVEPEPEACRKRLSEVLSDQGLIEALFRQIHRLEEEQRKLLAEGGNDEAIKQAAETAESLLEVLVGLFLDNHVAMAVAEKEPEVIRPYIGLLMRCVAICNLSVPKPNRPIVVETGMVRFLRDLLCGESHPYRSKSLVTSTARALGNLISSDPEAKDQLAKDPVLVSSLLAWQKTRGGTVDGGLLFPLTVPLLTAKVPLKTWKNNGLLQQITDIERYMLSRQQEQRRLACLQHLLKCTAEPKETSAYLLIECELLEMLAGVIDLYNIRGCPETILSALSVLELIEPEKVVENAGALKPQALELIDKLKDVISKQKEANPEVESKASACLSSLVASANLSEK